MISMVKEEKSFRLTEILITLLVGALAIVVAVLMVLLQEYYKLFPPSPDTIIIQLILGTGAYLFLIFFILVVMYKGFGKKKR